MGKLRYQKPKTSTVSPIPAIWYGEKTVQSINEIKDKWPQRVPRGQELLTAHAATMVRDWIQAVAPPIEGYGDYSKGLKVVQVANDPEWRDIAFAIVHPEVERTLNDDEQNTLLIVDPRQRASGWVWSLRKHGPWPANMLPANVPPSQGRVIARETSQSSIQKETSRLLRDRVQIEADLKRGGLKNAEVTVGDNPMASKTVSRDLGSAVLDVEFGRGVPRRAHWVPMVKRLQMKLTILGNKYVEYLETGKEGVFRTDVDGTISASRFRPARKFSEVITAASGVR